MSSTICLVVKMHGFYANGFFHCRELGFSSATTRDDGAHRFDVTSEFMTYLDWNGARRSTQKIHGMDLNPESGERVLPASRLKLLLVDLYETCRRPGKSVVAYVGGIFLSL